VPGRDVETVGEALARRGIAVRAGLHCAPLAHRTAGTLDTGTVRVSFSAFNTPQEADRLVSLINDILRLSQLDEGGALPHEQVSVLELAQEAARSLTAQAAAQAVHISVTGTAGTVFGVRRLLYEIARNLCENAVKYNVPGGSVTVEVAETERDVTFLVRDTGIGIPEGDQSRVFERFYRVDKSHSRAIGGTGLGLSIVKHAVAYHHGTLRLESQPGKGTVITVTLPKEPTE
jgi:two-component system phosphate regulon sensor histidine kinase PhoR